MITSTIRTNPLGKWYIELRDEFDEERMAVCLDINEYAVKVEEMGEPYGGNVEIVWSSDEDVTPVQINEVRQQMMAYEAELEAQKAQEGQNATHQADGTPNFS